MQGCIDHGNSRTVYFKKLREGEIHDDDVVDMEPPETIDGVSRKIGMTYLPLAPIDLQQMATKNPMTLARSWNYGIQYEQIPNETDHGNISRAVGVLRLDGWCQQGMRIFLSSRLPTYTLDDTIYLPDIYNNMLIQGLCVKLCDWHKLAEYKEAFDLAFSAAKMLIKRNNITQRMIQVGTVGRGYNDAYYDGVAGEGW